MRSFPRCGLLVLAFLCPLTRGAAPAPLLKAEVRELTALHQKTQRLVRQRRLREALTTWSQKLVLERKAWGPRSPQVVRSLRGLAHLAETEENFPLARKALPRLL